MYLYCPSNSNKNEPEMPGKIIAQMAIMPETNKIGNEWLAAIGFKLTKMNVKIAPIIAKTIFFKLISLSFLNRITAEAIIKPKKNEYVHAG